MGDTFVWTGADSSGPAGGSKNLDDPTNWFDQTTNSVPTHAPGATDTAIFNSGVQGLYPDGTSDGNGGFIISGSQFAPATLEIAPGARVMLQSGESSPVYTAGTLLIGAGGSLVLQAASLVAGTTEIAAGATLDLSQAFWVGAPFRATPATTLSIAVTAAESLNFQGPLNADLGALTLAAGGSLVLGDRFTGATSFTDANPLGSNNSLTPEAGVSGAGQMIAPNLLGPYGGVMTRTIDFGTVELGQTVTMPLVLNSGPPDTGLGIPTGAIQTTAHGASITDSDLSGAGVTAQTFGTADFSPSGPVATATYEITLDAQHLGSLSGQAVNIAFALNGGTYESNILVPIVGAVVAPAGGALVVPCFAAGTLVLTEAGERPVETLAPGDVVRTASGRRAPVGWVGRREVDLAGGPAPVRIAAGALAPGVPRRELLLSPDHALLLGGVLVPARLLVNGASIARQQGLRRITYVHVELDRHDALLAEGAAAESFLDTGNRGQFAAGGGAGGSLAASLAAYAERGCARLCLDGGSVAQAHAAALAQARRLGWRMTESPMAVLSADGRVLGRCGPAAEALTVTLPADTRALRLVSRSFVPDEQDGAQRDGRRLGVAAALWLNGVLLDAAAFTAGWYAADAGCDWRWSDGAAWIALPELTRPAALSLRLMHSGGRYWLAPHRAAGRLAA